MIIENVAFTLYYAALLVITNKEFGEDCSNRSKELGVDL